MENNLEKKYIVYVTMNTINSKIYIGVHGTYTPYKFDNYLGCGSWVDEPSSYNKGKYPLHAAILKYGTHAFKRQTLKVFDTMLDALDLEKWLVTEEFIKQSNNYNATVGGGMPPLLTKPVNQFDLNGKFIKTWDSEQSIRDYFQSKVSISKIIKTKRNFAGYFWSDTDSINIKEYLRTTKRGFIDLYDLDGNYITSYSGTLIASLKLDIDFKKLNMSIFRQRPCDGYMFLKSGIDISDIFCKNILRTANKHPIYRYLKSGEYDSEYATTVQAVRATPHANGSSLRNAVLNGYLCGGYRWSYYKASNYYDLEEPKKDTKVPAIEQYDKEGNLIKLWKNPKECKKLYPYCYDVCRGKCKSTQGYVFKYQTN